MEAGWKGEVKGGRRGGGEGVRRHARVDVVSDPDVERASVVEEVKSLCVDAL